MKNKLNLAKIHVNLKSLGKSAKLESSFKGSSVSKLIIQLSHFERESFEK